jgi:predicted hotdog family 3-hydroxylacyl-ACP dehydratase
MAKAKERIRMRRLGATIEDLLPHRDRMLLIDEILAVDDKSAVTSAVVNDRWPFFDGKTVNSLVLIELAAQTAGITNGLVRIKRHGHASEKKGWLVGIKESRIYVDSVALNTRIIIRAENQFEYEKYRQVQGTATIGSDLVAEVLLQLIQTETA